MQGNCRNIYKAARLAAGLTQERAAEMMSLSVDSLVCNKEVRKMEEMTGKITAKGLALLAAIDAGLCPVAENGTIDETIFERFWTHFEKNLVEYFKNNPNYPIKMFDHKTEDESYKRYKHRCYRNLILKALLFFILGLFCGRLLKL